MTARPSFADSKDGVLRMGSKRVSRLSSFVTAVSVIVILNRYRRLSLVAVVRGPLSVSVIG